MFHDTVSIIMYISMVRIYPSPGCTQAVVNILNTLMGPFAANANCLGCLITVEAEENGVVCYTEQWRTRDALDRHLRSLLFNRVLEAMECSRQQPEVDFYEVTGVGGLELVAHARNTH
jgi:quinol monooxygenase YgiN